MHSQISKFPSDQFYKSKLMDHQSVVIRDLPIHILNLSTRREHISRTIFFDLQKSKDEKSENYSTFNMGEVEFTERLFKVLVTMGSCEYQNFKDMRGKIGIITPYKA